MDYAAPRGTRDILPEEAPRWRWIEEKFRRLCRHYNYQEIRTPIFEEARLFIRSAGEGSEVVTKQMYLFEDRGGDQLALRPEGTAGVIRAYLQAGFHATQSLTKLYYIGPAFRYERPQAGRYRQHHQVGVEAIGASDPALDAEVIALAWDYLLDLGITGHTLYINTIGCRDCRPAYYTALREFLKRILPDLCPDCKRRFEKNPLRILDCKEEQCRSATEEAPVPGPFLCEPCKSHFAELEHHLEDLEIEFSLDPRLVRGLDYYTRTVFEIKHPALGAQDTIVGGGRYDYLVEELGGPPTPCVGFGSGIERTLLVLEAQKVHPPDPPGLEVFVATVGEKAYDRGVLLTGELRRAGFSTDFGYGGRSLKAQMRQADRLGALVTVILGDEEIAQQVAIVRRMDTHEQRPMELEDFPRKLREWLMTSPPTPRPF